MTNTLYYNYYYRYREKRKQTKVLVDASQFVAAKTRLENDIAEQSNFYPDMDTNKDFNFGEKIMMTHALNHLNVVIDKNDPPFTDNGIIKHHSDIVKDALLREPKQDYSL